MKKNQKKKPSAYGIAPAAVPVLCWIVFMIITTGGFLLIRYLIRQ